MRRLFTTYYNEANPERRAELDKCIYENVQSGLFDHIYILLEYGVQLPFKWQHHLGTCQMPNRPTYRDMFGLINLQTNSDDINVVANTDIFFDDTIVLAGAGDMKDICFALSRWDVQPDGQAPKHHALSDSQDAWVFTGPVKPTYADFALGIPGCDNRIAYELQQAGYTVANPSLTIKAYHLHLSGIRNYKVEDRAAAIPRPYLFVEPTYLRIQNEQCDIRGEDDPGVGPN